MDQPAAPRPAPLPLWVRARRFPPAALIALPWLAGLLLLLQALIDPLARTQLMTSWRGVLLYLAGWSLAAWAGLRLWRALANSVAAGQPEPGTRNQELGTWPSQSNAWLIVPLLAGAAVLYWNGAVLDPLQFRGFPDFVTQLTGARRLLNGELPYDPTIRVWTDVNLPPITLLLLFAPFSPVPDATGRLLYFAANQVAFIAGLAALLAALRPRPAASLALVVALALAYEPWHDSLRLGQQNGIVLCFLALSLYGLLRGRETLAGVALALALIAKPAAALLGIYFLLTRRWRAAAGAAMTGLVAFAVTLPWAGLDNWRYYLLEKAPEILAGTPQQSNVALLAFHARLFLPAEALSSFDAMPPMPVAQLLTRLAQAGGLAALFWLTRGRQSRRDSWGVALEFAFALALSLSLVGHSWQSYTTWLILAYALFALPEVWAPVPRGVRPCLVGLAAAAYTLLALDDVALFKVVGNTTTLGAILASLPNLALLALAFALATLLHARDLAAVQRQMQRQQRHVE